MPCNATTFIVPTKVDDNCSYSAQLMQQVIGQEERDESKAKFDAFQYYSNDLLRLKTLLRSSHENANENVNELNALTTVNDALKSAGLSLSNLFANCNCDGKDASKRRRGNSSQPIKQEDAGTPRKTRLSWELHPSLLLHDLYYQVGENIRSISDDEDDHEEQQVQATPLSKFKEWGPRDG